MGVLQAVGTCALQFLALNAPLWLARPHTYLGQVRTACNLTQPFSFRLVLRLRFRASGVFFPPHLHYEEYSTC